MTNVLIAVDESDEALAAAETAKKLFGDDASYFVLNVGSPVASAPFSNGHAYTVLPTYTGVMMEPMMVPPAATAQSEVRANGEAVAEQRADNVAHEVAEKAELGRAEMIAEVGDTADSILRAASDHAIDVIVVGSHERSWFSRLVSGSVTGDVIKQSTIPVLVVK